MKQVVFRMVVLVLFMAAGLSCSTNEPVDINNNEGMVEAVITAGIKTTTRAEDANWDMNDAIGLAMLVRNGTEIINDIYNYRYYTTTGTGDFVPSSPAQRIFFPLSGQNVSFRSYYPYYRELSENMIIPVSVADQTKLPDVDFMSSEHLSGFSKDDPFVELRFHHRLSKLIFNFTVQDGDTFVDPSTMGVTIKGMFNGGTYDLLSEQLTIDGNTSGDITLVNSKADANKYGIVMPRPAGQGVTFEFKTPEGLTFTAPMDEALELRSGFKYVFNVNVLKTEVQISAEIMDWEEGPESEYSVLEVAEQAGESQGAVVGDVMNVYIDGANGYEFLNQYVYNSDGRWHSDTPAYWQDIEGDPVRLRASIIRGQAYPTQLADILIADQIEIARNKAARFTFRHAASRVFVRLSSTTFSRGDLAGADIVLPNYETGGLEQNGSFVPGVSRGDVTVDRGDVDNSVALIQPQTVAVGAPVAYITIDGQRYEVQAAPQALTYEGGVTTVLNIRLEKEAITYSVEVVDWTYTSLDMDVLEIGVPQDGAVGVRDGEMLMVYRGTQTARTYMSTYTYVESGDTWNPSQIIYWEDLPDQLTLYASILRRDKYNDSQLDDYLVAEPVNAAASDGVRFELSHAAAMVAVQLISQDGTFSNDELEAISITLPGYKAGGYVEDGLFFAGTVTADIEVEKNVGEYGNGAIALIQPQTITAGSKVVRLETPGGRIYEVDYSANITFGANVATVLNIDMSKTALTLSARVTDWQQGETISMTLRAITIGGTNLSTNEFFENKSIDVYKLGTTTETYPYEYILEGSSYIWKGETIYWDDQYPLPLNLGAAYFPSQGLRPTVGQNDTSFPWELPEDQKTEGYVANDLLMSYISLAQPEYVNFMFRHPLSKVRVELEGVEFTPEELQGTVVRLNDFIIDGGAVLSTASMSATGTPKNVTMYVDADGSEYSALVMPQNKAEGDQVLTITLPGYPATPFPGVLVQDLAFEPGKVTIIKVTLRKTAIELSARYEDWTDGMTGTVTIE